MSHQRRRLAPLLATAVVLALILAAVPGGAATAGSLKDCKVANRTTHTTHKSLQRAVWRARPGDRLVVRGTCTGTTVIRKNLHIRGIRVTRSRDGRIVDSGPARIRDRDASATIIVDPRVTRLTIAASVAVVDSLVIGDVAKWRRTAVPRTVRPPKFSVKPRIVSTCRPSIGTGSDLAAAIASADPGQRVKFLGTCRGQIQVRQPLKLIGARAGASSITCAKDGSCVVAATDTGPARIRSPRGELSFVVDPSVDELVLAGFRINHGFRIGPSAP